MSTHMLMSNWLRLFSICSIYAQQLYLSCKLIIIFKNIHKSWSRSQMYHKRNKQLYFRKVVSLIVCFCLFHITVSAQEQTDSIAYDPSIHIWQYGMQPTGNMHQHIHTGTVTLVINSTPTQASIPLFSTTGVDLLIMESGSFSVAQGWHNIQRTPNGVRESACDEDRYVDYYNVPRTEVFNNDLRVNSPYWYDQLIIGQHGGLNGGYYCWGDQCTISLCFSSSSGTPWSLKLSWN